MLDLMRVLRKLMPLLPEKAARFLTVFSIISSLLALIDVAALGILAMSMTAMAQKDTVKLPLFGEFPPDKYIWLIGLVSLLIISKSFFSIVLQWIATRRFAKYELEIGDKLFAAYVHAPWTERIQRSTPELVRMADVGISAVISGFILPISTLPTLIATSVSVLAVILIAQPMTALVTLAYLGFIALLLYFWVSRKSVQAGRVNQTYSFKVARLMTEMMGALKEVTLRGKADEVAAVVHENRIHTTRARANLGFLGQVPKFVLEAALIGGFVLVGGFAYLIGGPTEAIAAIALFAVAGFRLVPSLTGFQAIITQTHASMPQVNAVMGDIEQAQGYLARAERVTQKPFAKDPELVEFQGVHYTYPGASIPAVKNVNFSIPIGSTVGLVGASGAGKSTIVDLLLGLLLPTEGNVLVDDNDIEEVLGSWRARVGYVPQQVSLFDGTVAQNVALSWSDDIDLDKVKRALQQAQLWDVIEQRPGQMLGTIGEGGTALSGGQRQRLGIARALYSDPLVLVLDEATSALDTKTEADVSRAIHNMKGEVTVVAVAHRLSTIRDSDQVLFMRDGEVTAQGSFDELVEQVPEFALQASLAGIIDPPERKG